MRHARVWQRYEGGDLNTGGGPPPAGGRSAAVQAVYLVRLPTNGLSSGLGTSRLPNAYRSLWSWTVCG